MLLIGCNTGIGKETAFQLSKKGATILMLCRNVAKAEEAAEEIRKATGNPVEVRECDLSSLESVRTCAEELVSSGHQIDILINNAGKFVYLTESC